jgi:O-antigen/teichoic acid export membrane protein
LSRASHAAPRHILVLCHRDPLSPGADGEDTGLRGQIETWVARGHRVTVVAGRRAGEDPSSQVSDLLTVHRLRAGNALPARAAWTLSRGLADDADVVLEVVGRHAFLTPLWTWLRQPRAVLVDETERRGRVGRLLFERLGMRHLYRGTPLLNGRAAADNLEVLRDAAEAGYRPLRAVVRESETFKAVGLAAATLAGNAIALLFTIVFSRILGATGYGALASVVSAFLILSIGGSALQVAVARETALGNLGNPEQTWATLTSWMKALALGAVVITGLAAVLRDPVAHLVTVPDHAWAAAATLPAACLWVGLSLQRGVLQGLHVYRPVAASIVIEAGGRLAGGLLLVAVGSGVTGAFLGTPVALLVTMVVLDRALRRRLGPHPRAQPQQTLGELFAASRVPVAALTLLAVLQNVDVIVVHDQIGGDRAGSYAAAAVAAKLVVWVGIGVGLYLLPEATRRRAAGEDARPVLVRALAVLSLVAAPALLLFALVPHFLLSVAFGPRFTHAEDALVVLGVAMTLLTTTYLAVQYLLAVGRRAFLWVLGAVAATEPIVLIATDLSLLGFAVVVLAIQAVAAVGVIGLGMWRGARARAA